MLQEDGIGGDQIPNTAFAGRIERGFVAWGRLVSRYRWLVLAASVAFAGLLTNELGNLTVDNSTEAYFHPGDPTRDRYDAFREQFGQDERLVIAIEPDDLFDQGFLDKLRDFHRELEEEVPHLDEVTSFWNARNTRGEGDELIVEDLLEEWPQNARDLQVFKARVLRNPLYRNTLISSDATTTVISLEASLYSGAEETDEFDGFDEPSDEGTEDDGTEALLSAREVAEFVDGALGVAARYDAPDFRLYFGGAPLREVQLGRILNRDASTFLGACLGMIVVVLFAVFRRISGVVIPVVLVVVSLVSCIATLPLLGIAFSMTLQIIPTLILTVGVCDAIHLLALFYQNLDAGQKRSEAIASALGHCGQALAMTTLTTAGGLASFATASVAPVAAVGIIAPIGILLTFLFTVTLLPALLAILPIRPKAVAAATSRLDQIPRAAVTACGNLATRYPRTVIAFAGLFAAIALVGANDLRFSLDTLHWYPAEERVRIDTEFIDSRFHGGSGLEVIIDSGRKNGLYEPDVMNKIAAAAEAALSFQTGPVTVGKATSVADVLKEIHQALNDNDGAYYVIPQDRELIAQELLLFESSGSDDLESIIDSQFRTARLSVRVPDVDGFYYKPFLVELRESLTDALGGLDFYLTGPTPMNNGVFTNMVRSMFESYAIALALISAMMVLMIGNLRRGLLSMLPNLLPIVATLGLMGWTGRPLDLSSILLGGILLGIAVDDTIHFMHGFETQTKLGHDSATAIRHTLQTTGNALFTTTVVLAGGFLVVSFAYMVNFSTFGTLACFATLVAFASDIILAPALLTSIRSASKDIVATASNVPESP